MYVYSQAQLKKEEIFSCRLMFVRPMPSQKAFIGFLKEKETVIMPFLKRRKIKEGFHQIFKREGNCNYLLIREGSKKGEGSEKETVPPKKTELLTLTFCISNVS